MKNNGYKVAFIVLLVLVVLGGIYAFTDVISFSVTQGNYATLEACEKAIVDWSNYRYGDLECRVHTLGSDVSYDFDVTDRSYSWAFIQKTLDLQSSLSLKYDYCPVSATSLLNKYSLGACMSSGEVVTVTETVFETVYVDVCYGDSELTCEDVECPVCTGSGSVDCPVCVDKLNWWDKFISWFG